MLAKSETYERRPHPATAPVCAARPSMKRMFWPRREKGASGASSSETTRRSRQPHASARWAGGERQRKHRRTGPRSRAGRTCTCGHARVRASGSLSQGTKTPWGKAASSVPGGQMCGAGRRAGRRAALSSGQALIASQRQAAQTTRWQHHKGPSRMWAAGVRSGVRLGSPLPEVNGHRKPAHQPSTARPHARRR